ncbi:MAG: glycosyltransferase family 1 protein [Actinomycetota bacterium]|nr:glycosyltransferase family 1 protein [Actinomycetota bacterium]
MRVAVHAGQLLQPVPGGIGRYTSAMLAHLPEVGVEPVAFAAGGRPSTVPPRVPWIDLGWPHGSMRYEAWHRFRRPAIGIDADVVHAPSLAVPPAGHSPLVVTVHDIAFLRVPGGTTRRGTQFHQRGLELARKEADLVLAPSAFTRLELIREGFEPDHVMFAPLGVNPALPRAPEEIDATVARSGVRAPYVLTVGTIEPRKDLGTIVAAVEQVRKTMPQLSLVVVGPRGWGEVGDLDRPGVHVVGELPWRVVDALYRRALVCCIASRYEGFGLPAVEALARSAPLIATDGSALSEVVDSAGLLFPAGDVDALVEAMKRVIDDEPLRAELGRRGLARAEQLTWAASAKEHARAFAQAASRYELHK